MSDFFAMGGYGTYVWSAYSLSFVVLVAIVWFARRNLANTRERLKRQRLSSQERTP
ncbi:MAG: heme exporter protein CcmD [Gammaproteobacteria bacterium]|jgi:heme exporter protein D|nr:heme exporter protein CcmD [Gammaproteobacteria bacterium]MDP6616552.1 heme exporter protein CcmD [Gammaproteobacteria bacterium]MDP6694199.1 heme exporter protein CcmD [Gammaproteobacteria bacterium]